METGCITVSLLALFAAAVFQPHRIKSTAACWIAVVLFSFVLVLPTFGLAALGTEAAGRSAPSAGGFVAALTVLTFVSRVLLAAGLVATAFALLPNPMPLIQRFATSENQPGVGQEPNPAQPVQENACLSCGQPIPPEASKCLNCGWNWEGEDIRGD